MAKIKTNNGWVSIGIDTVNGQGPDEHGNVDIPLTDISDIATDKDIPSAKAVYEYVSEHEGVTDYTELDSKPSINNIELLGNKTLLELGIKSPDVYNQRIEPVTAKEGDIWVHDDTDYLTFIAEGPNCTISVTYPITNPPTIWYSTNNGFTWNTFDSTVTLNAEDAIILKGKADNYAPTALKHVKFTMTGTIYATGSIESLWSMRDYAYYGLFEGCTSLMSAPKLPCKTLALWCYGKMFSGCTSLTNSPYIGATSTAVSCCESMFEGCASLTVAPKLNIPTLSGNRCYYSMFKNCTSLVTPPVLRATTLSTYCYAYMFDGCTNLATAPLLPATTLATNCYYYMFSGCTSLTVAPALKATNLPGYCYYYMFNGCTSLTKMDTFLATSFASMCCANMFRNCSSFNDITVHFTTWPSSTYLSNWLNGVSSTGTFTCPSTLADTRGVNNIPNGWTKVDLA